MRYTVRLALTFALAFCAPINNSWAQNTNTTTPATAPAAAATSAATNTPATVPSTAGSHSVSGVVGSHNAVYTDLIPPDQMVTLTAGDDKFQGWYIADLSGRPRGAAIVLHDSGHLPSWPFTAAALINDLPLHGWNTLNIELPTPADDQLPPVTATPPPVAAAAPATTAPSATTAPATLPKTTAAVTPATAVEQRTQARISAAIKYFTDQNQHNIVLIGFGSGAIRAAEEVRLLAAANTVAPAKTSSAILGDNAVTKTEPLTALVLISPQQQLNGIELDLPKLLPLTAIPTLDMTLDSMPQTRAEAEARRRAVLHQRTRIYTALELPPINDISNAQQSPMVRRVQAWLKVNAHAPQKPAEKADTSN